MLRHYPVYPVCRKDGTLIGVIRGQMLFEAETVELSLQAGSMVGVEKEERLDTPWWRSLRCRHPWLQGNLLLGLRCGSGRRVFRRDDRSLCGAGRFPAGVDRAIG